MASDLGFRLRRRLSSALARRRFLGPGPGGTARRSVLLYLDYEREFGNPGAGPSAAKGYRGVVDTLASARVSATWCTVGLVVDAYPETLVELVAGGHEIACHTYSHRPVTEMGPSELAEELVRFRRRVSEVCGAPVAGFHAPLDRWTLGLPGILRATGFGYDLARDDDPRRQQAHVFASAVHPREPGMLRIPSIADDWPLVGQGLTAERMLAAWQSRLAAVPRGRSVAVGFHPWVLGADPARLRAFARFVEDAVADEDNAFVTGSEMLRWYAADARR